MRFFDYVIGRFSIEFGFLLAYADEIPEEIVNRWECDGNVLAPYSEQGCQMAYFQANNPNLGKFRRVLQWQMLV
jgi:hypothetical protein